MADSEVEVIDGQSLAEETTANENEVDVDVEMVLTQTSEVVETKTEPVNGAGEHGDGTTQDDSSPRHQKLSFVDNLKSPIVEITVGKGPSQTLLRAHQALLCQSPYFAGVCALFQEDEVMRVELPEDDMDAIGCFLQYIYTGEYFPRKLLEARALEHDPNAPAADDTGEQLLKHARIYTLAEKLGMPTLKTLAHSKIHRINSTAKGEIKYARYVYANTPRDDATIRKPIAAFWAHRSHVLRHEAEDEFRKMCLEYPEFGFDVLSLVLDAKEKGRDKDHGHPGEKSSRKRVRTSTAG